MGSTPGRVVRLTLGYDGTGFRGWAHQADQRTVEGVLRDALGRFLGSAPELSVAGRTDAGVHARAQVASFALEPGAEATVDLGRLQTSVNAMLGPEVVVSEARLAPPGFDARFSASARGYRYRIETGPWPDPFTARFVWHRPGELSLSRMRGAAAHLVGEHDFTSFCRRPPRDRSTVRSLERLAVVRGDSRIEIAATANAFLHQMVRSLVGTLVAVGAGSREPEEMSGVLAARDRSAAGQLAPAHGLTLERIVYGRRVPP